MSDNLWYILAFCLWIPACLLAWLHRRKCRKQGIPPDLSFKKHEKRVNRLLDMFLLVVIIGGFFVLVPASLSFFSASYINEYDPVAGKIEQTLFWSAGFLGLLVYSSQAVFLTGLLSPFHKNLSFAKRGFLLALSLLPILFLIGYLIYSNRENPKTDWMLFFAAVIPGLINIPPIVFGKSFPLFFHDL